MPVGSQLFETAVDEERVVSLGPHQLTLGKGTRLTVSRNGDAADTEIKLAHGTVFCDVAPLSPGGSFRILAGDTVVSVLGTSFLVSFDGDARLQVAVMKGRVRVQHGSETRLLEAGDTLSLPADEPAVVPENVPVASGSVRETGTGRDRIRPSADFDSWRAMISAGRHEEAAAGIRTYLTAEPSDDRARMLLAGVERRQGRHVDALASYDQVIANRSSHLVHQARYLCAEISRTGLGDHERAIGYYDAYLKHAPADAVNRPEAELHLSESLLATGRTAQARAHLENISRQYGRTPVADRARALLEKIATPRP
jgi:hypothetical protein